MFESWQEAKKYIEDHKYLIISEFQNYFQVFDRNMQFIKIPFKEKINGMVGQNIKKHK